MNQKKRVKKDSGIEHGVWRQGDIVSCPRTRWGRGCVSEQGEGGGGVKLQRKAGGEGHAERCDVLQRGEQEEDM